MVKVFFKAQFANPVKNDWTIQVQEDLKYLELEYSNDEINFFKKGIFARKVKKQIRKIALRELTKVIPSENNTNKRILSKMAKLKYLQLEIQDYFKSEMVNIKCIRNFSDAKKNYIYENILSKNTKILMIY